MTSRLPAILFIAVAILCGVGVTRSAWRLSDAHRQVNARERAVHDTAALAAEITTLREQEQRVERQSRPEQDVIARVNAVLSKIGIPQNRFSGLSPESDIAVQTNGSTSGSYSGGGGHTGGEPCLRRQTVRLNLSDLELAELGQFLAAWRRINPMWTTTRIDLNHRTGRDATDNRYDVTILLSAIYLDERESSA